ncbi:hypothetical protein [Streptomyces anulatus]|uniref:hypothetical protein n=1 Tax=Streptomyces anulatus TaxID=1892 RepID=UPI001D1805C5|nr:hypothetical protein [Streptomyces anulatus]
MRRGPPPPGLHGTRLPPQYEFFGHGHICPVCMGAEYQPEWFGEERIIQLDGLLTDARDSGTGQVSWFREKAHRLMRR